MRNKDKLNKVYIDEMKDIAKSKGGICLSDKWVNSKTEYRFKCKKGHYFTARQDNVVRGSWCPVCNRRVSTKVKIKEDGKTVEVPRSARKHFRNYPNKNASGTTSELFFIMKKGGWQSLSDLQKKTKTENIQVHMRKLRSMYYGNHIIEKKYKETIDGINHYSYRLKVNENWSINK